MQRGVYINKQGLTARRVCCCSQIERGGSFRCHICPWSMPRPAGQRRWPRFRQRWTDLLVCRSSLWPGNQRRADQKWHSPERCTLSQRVCLCTPWTALLAAIRDREDCEWPCARIRNPSGEKIPANLLLWWSRWQHWSIHSYSTLPIPLNSGQFNPSLVSEEQIHIIQLICTINLFQSVTHLASNGHKQSALNLIFHLFVFWCIFGPQNQRCQHLMH